MEIKKKHETLDPSFKGEEVLAYKKRIKKVINRWEKTLDFAVKTEIIAQSGEKKSP